MPPMFQRHRLRVWSSRASVKGANEALVPPDERARSRGLDQPQGPDILIALLDDKEAIGVLELFDDEPEKLKVALDFHDARDGYPDGRRSGAEDCRPSAYRGWVSRS
jgi:hypothetical protein